MFHRRTLLKSGLAAAAVSALPFRAFGQANRVNAPFPIYDTHAHFYTYEPQKYPFQAQGARYGAERMIAKAKAKPITPETVFDFWSQGNILMGTGVQYNSAYSTDNSYLLDCAAAYPDRIHAVVILNPVAPETPDQLRKMTKENKIVGVRFMGMPRDGDYVFFTDAARATWEAANELGIVVVLMPFGGDANLAMGRVYDYAMRYPNLNIVLDHIGFPNPANYPDTFGFTPMHHALAACKNVHYKYTTFLMLEILDKTGVKLNEFMDYAVKLYGPDQFMWGSDIGNSEGEDFDDIAYLQKVLDASAHMPYATRRAIFFSTAYRIFVPGGGSPVQKS